jgi:hypothetical protein
MAGHLTGCDQSVNLDAPFEQKLVVYAVLSNRTETQFARVYTNYSGMEGTTDSTRYGAMDVTMTVGQGSRTYVFTDTLVVGDSVNGQPAWIRTRVAHQLSIEEGKSYELVVSSPSLGMVRSTVVSLLRGEIYVQNPESLDVPTAVARIPVVVTLGSNAAAYILRFYLEYEYLLDVTWYSAKVEVPWTIEGGESEAPKVTYPSLLARGQKAPISPRGSDGVTFPGSAYRYVVSQIHDQYPGGNARLKRAIFSLTQIDYPMYAYYSTVNEIPGAGTLRLDEPDYTNIQGGFGVFATQREDVITYVLSPGLGP